MIGVTASALPRLMNCEGSRTLPRAENYSPWAEMGNADHEELSDFASLPPELAKHIPPDAQSEVKLAYDVSSRVGRIIGAGAGRAYGNVGPLEIAGSADVLGVEARLAGDTVVVNDFKTGFNPVAPAATNEQLHFYAVAAAAALDLDRAIVRIIYTKLRRVDEHVLETDDLRDFRNRLESLFTAPPSTTTREGAWCRYCPSKHVCPSKNGALVQLATGGLAIVGDAEMTPDRAAEAVRQMLRLKAMVEDAEARAKAYVNEHGPIDLGDGNAYGVSLQDGRERIANIDATVAAIRAVVGDKEQVAAFESVAIERSTSKAAIERGAKAIGAKPKLAKAVIDEIRKTPDAIVKGAEWRKVGVFPIAKVERAPLDIPYEDVNRLLEAAG